MAISDRHIYLIGFSGSGKSTIGPKLARRMKRPFIDIDERISERMKLTIPEIFREHGERRFRKEERVLIEETESERPSVIAVGGGAFENAHNRSVMSRNGVTVYLSCARKEIYRRLRSQKDRPLLQTGSRSEMVERIRTLLDRRIDNYRRADITVSTTSRSTAKSVDHIVRKLEAVDG